MFESRSNLWMLVISFVSILAVAGVGHANLVTIEPDDYADDTVLKTINPAVTLRVQLSSGTILSDVISVTASEVSSLQPNGGTNVFGHAGISFMSNERRLRMDFTNPTDFVEIAFTSTANSVNFAQTGRLEAYDVSGDLITSYDTAPLLSGQSETMTIAWSAEDIAYALAWTSDNEFGQLDTLRFNAVPEPTAAALALCSAAGVMRRRRTLR